MGAGKGAQGPTMSVPSYLFKLQSGASDTQIILTPFSVLFYTDKVLHMEGVQLDGKSIDYEGGGPQASS